MALASFVRIRRLSPSQAEVVLFVDGMAVNHTTRSALNGDLFCAKACAYARLSILAEGYVEGIERERATWPKHIADALNAVGRLPYSVTFAKA